MDLQIILRKVLMNRQQDKPNKINADFLNRCIQVLETSYNKMQKLSPNNINYDIYRSACVKELEIILEQCGKLLKKKLRDYFHSNKAVDELNFKDIFRYATKHSLISPKSCENWIKYRDNRNNTAHDYGQGFAEQTLKLIPDFIGEAKAVAKIVES